MRENTDRLISRSVVYALLGTVAAGYVLYLLKGILAPVLLAFLLAYLFDPLVEILVRRKIPRSLASALCLLVLLLIAVGLFFLIVPTIHQELQGLAKRIPDWLARIRESVIPWLEETLGISVPATIDQALDEAGGKLDATATEITAPLVRLLQGILSGAASLISTLIYLVIVPLFTFYFLIDYKKITSFFKDLVPPRHREKVLSILGDIDDVLAGFIRGQGTVCFILAVVYSIALSIAGVPAGVTVGVVAGLFNFVPYLGTALGVILSCVFLLLEGAGAVSYAAVGGIFLVVNILDGLFLTPRILGKKLGLAPVAVILAIMAFSELFGFLGVLMAVPLTAIGKVLGKRVIKTYRQSRAFSNKKEAPGHQDSGPVDNEEDQASSE